MRLKLSSWLQNESRVLHTCISNISLEGRKCQFKMSSLSLNHLLSFQYWDQLKWLFIIEAVSFLHKNCHSHFDTQALLSFELLFQSFLQKKGTSFDKLWQLMIVATTSVCPNKFSSGWVSRLQRWYHAPLANQMIRFHKCSRSPVIVSESSYNYETSVRKLLTHAEVAEWNWRKTWHVEVQS